MPVNSRVGYALVGRNDIDSYEEAELKPKTRLQEELEQDRPQLVYVGRQHERSELVDVLMIREDVNEDHERTTSHMNSSWGDQLDHILSETEYEWHANLEPFDNMRSALECLVTEIALFHFRCEPPAEYMRVFHDFRAAAEVEDECGLLASVGGVAHEEIESEERKGKTAVFVAGWRSMEAHKDFKNTKTYREYMPKLLEGISGWRRTMCLFNACCREALDTPRIVDVSTQYILPICSLGRPSITLAILAWVFTAGESSATQRRT